MHDEERRAALARARGDTLAVRAGQVRSSEGEHSEALFLTSSYVFDSAADAAARFAGTAPGNVYSRYTNPTVRTFEERLAALASLPNNALRTTKAQTLAIRAGTFDAASDADALLEALADPETARHAQAYMLRRKR